MSNTAEETPFQVLQSGNDETIPVTILDKLEPEEIDRLLSYIQDPREYVTAH
jgi:hypothetical protein|nr:MAG TPA: hypothetical protein [Caudoviricetes sp.]